MKHWIGFAYVTISALSVLAAVWIATSALM